MPVYEVVERHHIRVAAQTALSLAAAREQDLLQLPLVRPIFKARDVILRATRDESRGIGCTVLSGCQPAWRADGMSRRANTRTSS